MKISLYRGKGKITWLLLVLALTSQTAVSCTGNSESAVQTPVAKQEKASETESAKEEEPVIIVQKDDWTKDGTDVADVDEDTEIEYADGDGERFVTRDVCFVNRAPHAMDTVWVSSDESVITNEGKVTRQKEDKTVTITADVSYHGKKYRKNFPLTVKRMLDTDADTLEDYSLDQIEERCSVEVDDSGYIRYIIGVYSDVAVDSWDAAMASFCNIKTLLGIGDVYTELEPLGAKAVDAEYCFEFSQVYKGVKVWRCSVGVVTGKTGRIRRLASSCFPLSGDIDTIPEITRKEAIEKVRQAGYEVEEDVYLEKGDLELNIYNENGKGRLIWFFYCCYKPSGPGGFEIMVDAKTGDIVKITDVSICG